MHETPTPSQRPGFPEPALAVCPLFSSLSFFFFLVNKKKYFSLGRGCDEEENEFGVPLGSWGTVGMVSLG